MTPTPRNRAVGAPKGNKNAVKHNLYTYKAMLDSDGLDERSSLFKALRLKEEENNHGPGAVIHLHKSKPSSRTQSRTCSIASLDNYLMGLKSLVRKGRPHPVLAIRTQLSAHLRENLKTLGLKRVSKTLTVNDLLNGHDEAQDRVNAVTQSEVRQWSSTATETFARTALTQLNGHSQRCANPALWMRFFTSWHFTNSMQNLKGAHEKPAIAPITLERAFLKGEFIRWL